MNEATGKSRILTLVFTDLADSTALKTEHGDIAVGDLISRHREHVARLTEECAGRVIDWAGDGCFLTFDTSSAGVMFALRLQQAHAEESDLPGVRVGIHMGEVTEKPGPGEAPRIEGLAVDIAARISGLAKPGQVLMSAFVYQSARQRLGVDAFGQPILWQAYGDYTLKGFDEPVDIREAGLEGLSPLQPPEASDKAKRVAQHGPGPWDYTEEDLAAASESAEDLERNFDKHFEQGRVAPTGFSEETYRHPTRSGSPAFVRSLALLTFIVGIVALAYIFGRRQTAPDSGEVLSTPEARITSLAVLPLNSFSDDPEQEYLADAITDSITSELAKIKALKVISNTSAMRYKNTDLSMPEIAAELGVDGLIQWSMLREADEVSITAQLIHGPSDTHVWSESYTSTITSVVKLQSDIALAIADAIGVELTGDERRRIATVHEVNPDAYASYIIGAHYLNDISKEGLFTAIEFFEEAVKIDPDYAHAWGGIVCAYWEVAEAGLGRPRDIYPKARSAGIRALQLNDDMSTDQSHLGMISMGYDHEWEQAEERFQHAIDLGPSDPIAHGDYAQFLELAGRQDEALQHAATSLDLNPNPNVFAMYLGLESIYLESDPERVRRNLERLLAEEPKYLKTLEALTLTYKYLKMSDRAVETAEDWVEQEGDNTTALTNLALALADGGQPERARIVLEKIDRIDDYFDSAAVGYAYVPLDDLDAAFEWLQKGYDSRDWAITRLRTIPYWKTYLNDPSWIRFRDDPRYRDLVERMNFPPLPPDHPAAIIERERTL